MNCKGCGSGCGLIRHTVLAFTQNTEESPAKFHSV